MRHHRPPAMNAIPPIDVNVAFKWAAGELGQTEQKTDGPRVLQCTGCWRCAPGKFERPKKRGSRKTAKPQDVVPPPAGEIDD